MKTLKESIFDEKEQMKNVENSAILSLLKKFKKYYTKNYKSIEDCKGMLVGVGDVVIFSNGGTNIMMGLVTKVDEESGSVLVNHSGEPNTGWWIETSQTLKINKNIAMDIVKTLK
jgi:uncharacterized protein YkvS